MKALNIARKTLLELWREPLTLGLLLGFPILLIVFYYVAFGETEQGLAKYLTVLVVNEDIGDWGAGAQLVEVMCAAEFEGSPVFEISVVTDRRTAEIALRERKAALLLLIPPDFSQSLLDAVAGGPPAALSLLGDPNSDTYLFAYSMLGSLLREFSRQVGGWQDDAIALSYEFVAGTGTMADFEFGVPGVIVFGIMLVTITTAQLMVQERVNGTAGHS